MALLQRTDPGKPMQVAVLFVHIKTTASISHHMWPRPYVTTIVMLTWLQMCHHFKPTHKHNSYLRTLLRKIGSGGNGGTAPLILNFGTTYFLGALLPSKEPPVPAGQKGLVAGKGGENPYGRFNGKVWPLPSIELRPLGLHHVANINRQSTLWKMH
jgi:hypothetical protein